MSRAALAPGDLLLVTGASGFIGSHVAHEALKAGLRVRLTVRTQEKGEKLISAFGSEYGTDKIELALVPDMSQPGAYNEAIKGVQGVAHVASNLTFGSEWDIVTTSVRGTTEVLASAAGQGSVRRVVVTSSSVAVGLPSYEKPQQLTPETWNEGAVAKAKAHPDPISVYTASKVEAEKAVWAFKATKPHFGIATVNPNLNIGPELPGASTSSTNAVLRGVANGDIAALATFGGSQFWINVANVAQLHIEALMNLEVGDERILAYHSVFTLRDLGTAVLAARPDAPLAKTDWLSSRILDVKDQSTVDNSRMLSLLGDRVVDLKTTVEQALAP